MVANFIPPAYDLANLIPSKINFRTGGLITAGFGFVIGGLWVSVITQMGIFPFVNTLGAILAPVFGIMIADYYIIKKQQLNVDALFDDSPESEYHYNGGFNRKAIIAWVISGYIAVGSVWPNILILGLDDFFANLGGGGGYAWIIGASLGALVHLGISKRCANRPFIPRIEGSSLITFFGGLPQLARKTSRAGSPTKRRFSILI